MGILRSMGQTARAYAQFRSQKLGPYGLPGNQCLYIRAVLQHPGITQDELAETLVFSRSNVSRTLASLESAGFVRQERSESDKRNLLVFPTEKAEEVLPKIDETSRDFFSAIARDLSPEERRLLEALCETVCERAKEVIRDAKASDLL